MPKPVILIVEDEVDLLQVTATAVRRVLPTYEVAATASREEAEEVLARLEAAGGTLALVISDHVLGLGDPRDGLGLLRTIRERHPAARLLLFTGRASQRVETEARTAGVHVMWKPARLSHLLDEIHGLLDRTSA